MKNLPAKWSDNRPASLIVKALCVRVFSECANSNMSMHVKKKGLAIISGALQPCLNWDPVSAEVKYIVANAANVLFVS